MKIPAISIERLTKYYRRVRAVNALSLEVRDGEFFGFLGPNGAGKTTTINVMTGLANYGTGTVRVFGFDVTRDYRKTRALIGLAPQEFNFDPYLTVEQILVFEAGYFGIPRQEARKRASELLDFFELGPKRSDGCKRLSGGMKRRLLIARALIHRPRILILDEPTAGVDLELRYQLWELFKRLNREGTTVVLTTHYIEEAEKLCSRIGVIHEGQMVALDETGALIEKMSGHQVELHLKEGLDVLPEEIAGIPVLLENGGRRIVFQERGRATAEVLRILYSRGIEIDTLDIRRPTLEDAFLKLTAKSSAGRSAP